MGKKLFSKILPVQDQNEMKKRAFQEIVEIAVESEADIVSDYGNEKKHEVKEKLFSKVATAIGGNSGRRRVAIWYGRCRGRTGKKHCPKLWI